MARPFRKQFWFWAVGVLVLAAILSSLPPVRTEYHKWRLQGLKKKRADYALQGLSGLDKVWAQVTGMPVNISNLNRSIQEHEDALVRLGFLQRERFVVETVSATEQVREGLIAIASGCPWQHVETLSGSNVVVTACAEGMEEWRKRAQELGWKCPGKG